MRWFASILLLVTACGGDLPDDSGGLPELPGGPSGSLPEDILEGQSGTEVPDLCLEKSRVAVTDPSVASPGFTYSVDALLAQVAGTWTGTIDLSPGTPALTLGIGLAPGTIYAVETEWVTGGGNSEGGALGAPEPIDDCLPFYELPMTVTVESGTLLDETFDVVATSNEVDRLDFDGILDPADVNGTTQPTFNPTSYDSYHLGLFGSVRSGTASGAVVWRGINDQEVEQPPQEHCDGDGFSGCIDPDTGLCGACVGVIGPPSVVEFVGYYDTQK